MADRPQRLPLAGKAVSRPGQARRILHAALARGRRRLVRQAIGVIRQLETLR
jgi:hypothetical protein